MKRTRALTLVELIGTLTVLALIVSVAFVGLGSITKYQDDQQTRSLLSTVRELQRRYAAMNDGYTTSPTDLSGVPTGYIVTSSPSTVRNTISMAVGSKGTLGLATIASSGACYTLQVPPLSGSLAGAEETSSTLPTTASCDGRSALTVGEYALPTGAPSDSPIYLLSSVFASGSQTLQNQGTAGSTLDAQLGFSSSSDSNDPVWLPYSGERYVYLPGVASNLLSTPDTAGTSPSGSLDIRMRLAAPSWTPSAGATLAAKWGAAGQRSYKMSLAPSGALSFSASSDGTNSTVTATSSSAVSFASNQVGWLRALYTVVSATTYQVAFFQSSDGFNWTALNTPATTTTTATSIFDSTATTRVGGADDASATLNASVYQATFYNSSSTAWLDMSANTCTQTSCAGSTSNAWSVSRAVSPLAQSVVVDRSLFLVAGTTWLNIAPNSSLDMSANQNATIVVAARFHGGPASGTPQVISHRDQTTASPCGTGWSMHQVAGATPAFQTVLSTGSVCQVASLSLSDHTAGVLGIVRSSSGNTLASFAGSSLAQIASKSGTTTGVAAQTYASSLPVRIGILASGTGIAADQPGSFELFGVAVYARALTDDEIVAVARLLGA